MSAAGIKKILGRPQSLLLRAPSGFKQHCLVELTSLLKDPATNYKFEVAIVPTTDDTILVEYCDLRQAVELVYRLRTARQIYLNIAAGHVGSLGDLNKFLAKTSWDNYLKSGEKLSLSCSSFQSKVYAENKIKSLVSDALVERGYKIDQAVGIPLQVIQQKNQCQLFLSLAGEALYQRGYKESFKAKAPLNENIASCLLCDLLSDMKGEDSDCDVFVPFAGSGTLGFECISLMDKIYPGVTRKRGYAMCEAPWFPSATWNFLETNLQAATPPETRKLVFSEKSPQQAEELAANLLSLEKKASTKLSAEVIVGDSLKYDWSQHENRKLAVLINPPYGHRLRPSDLSVRNLYRDLAISLVKAHKQKVSVFGFCLMAREDVFLSFRESLGELYTKTISFNQGGLHVRAVYFSYKPSV